MSTVSPIINLTDASLNLGGRKLWQNLSLEVAPGEFLAVLGPNGAGKTSLLRVLLGLESLAGGTVAVAGRPPRRGSHHIGYIPQQKSFDDSLPIRGRDLVRFGLDGHRFGWGAGGGGGGGAGVGGAVGSAGTLAAAEVETVIREVGAEAYADRPIGLLSGGEQQRLRVAQALLGRPRVLLCDEPLLSLDLAHQQAVTALINRQRQRVGAAVVFVTHDINPILPVADRILYLVGQRWIVGSPADVLTSERLSELYGSPVDVLRVHGRVIVVGADDAELNTPAAHHHADSNSEAH